MQDKGVLDLGCGRFQVLSVQAMVDFRDHELPYHITTKSILNDVAKVWTAREMQSKRS